MSRWWAVAAMGLFLAPQGASPQGLGDVAAREKAKRAKQVQAGKPEGAPTYTDADLEAGKPPGSKKKDGESAPAAGAEAGYSPPPEPSAERSREGAREDRAQQEREQAVKAAEDNLAAAQAREKELRDQLNPMSTTFIYGATGSNSPADEARVKVELAEAERAVAAARSELDSARSSAPGSGAGRETPH